MEAIGPGSTGVGSEGQVGDIYIKCHKVCVVCVLTAVCVCESVLLGDLELI